MNWPSKAVSRNSEYQAKTDAFVPLLWWVKCHVTPYLLRDLHCFRWKNIGQAIEVSRVSLHKILAHCLAWMGPSFFYFTSVVGSHEFWSHMEVIIVMHADAKLMYHVWGTGFTIDQSQPPWAGLQEMLGACLKFFLFSWKSGKLLTIPFSEGLCNYYKYL